MMVKLETSSLERTFSEYAEPFIDQINHFINDHMKNHALETLVNNYHETRDQLRESVHTPKTRRFFQLCEELFNAERDIYQWIGIAHEMIRDKSVEELTEKMIQVVSDGPYGDKKIEWQMLKLEVANLFYNQDFSALMAIWEEVMKLQRQTCLAAGKVVGGLIYKAFTKPNADILRSFLDVQLEAEAY